MLDPVYGPCRDCLAWLLPVRDVGQCRRHAPTVIPGPDVAYRGERVETHFPMTHAGMGCFEHVPAVGGSGRRALEEADHD